MASYNLYRGEFGSASSSPIASAGVNECFYKVETTGKVQSFKLYTGIGFQKLATDDAMSKPSTTNPLELDIYLCFSQEEVLHWSIPADNIAFRHTIEITELWDIDLDNGQYGYAFPLEFNFPFTYTDTTFYIALRLHESFRVPVKLYSLQSNADGVQTLQINYVDQKDYFTINHYSHGANDTAPNIDTAIYPNSFPRQLYGYTRKNNILYGNNIVYYTLNDNLRFHYAHGLTDADITLGLSRPNYNYSHQEAWVLKNDPSGVILQDAGVRTGNTVPIYWSEDLRTYLTKRGIDLDYGETLDIIPNWQCTISYDISEYNTDFSIEDIKNYYQSIKLPNTVPSSNSYSYTISFNDTGDFDIASCSASYRYKVTEWNTNKNGSGTAYLPNSEYLDDKRNGSITLYAQWEPGVAETISLPRPSKEGYIFNGWYTSDGLKVGDENLEYTPSNDIALYGKWTPQTYTINYNANGIGTAPSSQTKTHDQDLILQPFIENGIYSSHKITYDYNDNSSTKRYTITTKTYKQQSWKDGSSNTLYLSQDTYTNNKSTTLYAIWDNGTQSSTILPTITRTGYRLLGWSPNRTATTAAFAPGATYTPNASITLYAVWEPEGLVNIYTGTTWEKFIPYVYNGTDWIRILPYIYNGNAWKLYGE